MGKGYTPPEGRVWRWMAAALCLGAVLWTGWHLRWGAGTQKLELTASLAAARQEERMSSPWEGRLGTATQPIPVNRAGEEELCRLPGVGPVTARAIIAQREAWGPFGFPEDLLTVKGITPGKLERIIQEITLEK